MIGPVQLIMIGYRGPELPEEVRRQVVQLRSNPAVALLDAQVFCKERGNIHRLAGDLGAQESRREGDFLDNLMVKAGASQTFGEAAQSGRGYLMRGDPIPDRREEVPDNAHVLALFLEHRWCIPLWNAVRESDAYPAADAWMGRDALKEAGLDIGEP